MSESHLLLVTSCDGTLATTATPTTVRVVCDNTLTIALDGTTRAIKVPHSTRFDARAVKKQLGVAVSQWDEFMYRTRVLAERKVQWHEAMGFFMSVLCEVTPIANYLKSCPTNGPCAKYKACTKDADVAQRLRRHKTLPGAWSTP
ncbi:Mycobacteriophage Barnyard protein gp56 [Pseudomonas synxantha]|uniref:Mycobacteriophage Barnyard protein gp56 n=1 Tax=Pseudomonas synxantha TaxID=47883 RepID=A0A3G7U7J5_9PSED|nr:Mycobacteriophage Barnyard protein gp56 [Pseudomonas synxantha]